MALPNRLSPRRVRPFPPHLVTSRNPAEVDPRMVGLAPRDVEAIWGAVVRLYRAGLHPALGLCIRRQGHVLIDRTIGHARGNEPGTLPGSEVLATPATLFNLFSASKSVTAMLVHLLVERGLVDLDAPVVEYLPHFARHGKHNITVRDVLAHRAGVPATPTHALDLDLLDDPDAISEIICDLRPDTEAGVVQAYHAVTGGFILGEIIRKVTGADARTLLDQAIRQPLGFEHLSYGVRPDEVHLVAREARTGPRGPARAAQQLERSLGVDLDGVVRIANDPRFLTRVVPSANVIATANEVSRFFELLLRGGTLEGQEIFTPPTVRRAIREQNRALDRIILLPVRYGLGFMLGADMLSFYGPGTPRAFGHLGFTNVLAWADPERDISVALMNNGKPFLSPALVWWANIMRTIAARIPRR